MIANNLNLTATASRRALSFTVLGWSRERLQTTTKLINDMLRFPELYALEACHLEAAREALERAEVELNQVKKL